MPTVSGLLDQATRDLVAIDAVTPRLDAELLLGHVLGVERTSVIAHPDAPVSTGQEASFRELLGRRLGGVPVAYLRGFREFHGIAFSIDERVLIPRPETELLVDLAVERVRWVLTHAPRPSDRFFVSRKNSESHSVQLTNNVPFTHLQGAPCAPQP